MTAQNWVWPKPMSLVSYTTVISNILTMIKKTLIKLTIGSFASLQVTDFTTSMVDHIGDLFSVTKEVVF